MYFHTDDQLDLDHILGYVSLAAREGRRLRFEVRPNGDLVMKVGEGGWTAPIRSTPDPYRDHTVTTTPRSEVFPNA